MASATVSPAMNRRPKLVGLRMPYLPASVLSDWLRARRWKNVLETRSIIDASMRPGGRRQEVFDRPAVIAEHAPLADAEAAALQHDDAARGERLGGFLDRLTSAHDAEICTFRGELLHHAIDP